MLPYIFFYFDAQIVQDLSSRFLEAGSCDLAHVPQLSDLPPDTGCFVFLIQIPFSASGI